jgi:DNA-binding transcriptional ArsR family regulator
MGKAAGQPVRVISEVKVAQLLAVPIKRQILRRLADREMTQAMLAHELDVSDPTISYHLDALRSAGLVKVVRRVPEVHGIIQNFYRAGARYFVADYEQMPQDLKRYFLDTYLDRLRGAFAMLRALTGADIALPTLEMEMIADRLAVKVVAVAKEYQIRHPDENRESLIVSMYGEALKRLLEEDPAGTEALSSFPSLIGPATRSR